jgi:tryptophan-rich sensory protein
VVWPILYLMMGVSASLIWKRGIKKKEVRLALGLFILQLVLNGG